MYKTLHITSTNADMATSRALLPTLPHFGLRQFRFVTSQDNKDSILEVLVQSAGDMAESIAALIASLPKGVRVDVLPGLFLLGI